MNSRGCDAKSKRTASLNSESFYSAHSSFPGGSLSELMGLPCYRLNEQSTTGNRSTLVERVLECSTNGGALPRCLLCRRGILRAEIDHSAEPRAKVYVCPGYFEKKRYKRCEFRSSTVDRIPWKDLDH